MVYNSSFVTKVTEFHSRFFLSVGYVDIIRPSNDSEQFFFMHTNNNHFKVYNKIKSELVCMESEHTITTHQTVL